MYILYAYNSYNWLMYNHTVHIGSVKFRFPEMPRPSGENGQLEVFQDVCRRGLVNLPEISEGNPHQP